MFRLKHGKVINNFFNMSKFKPTGEQHGPTESEVNFSSDPEEQGRQITEARQKKEVRERLLKACETDDPQKLEAAREHVQNFDTHTQLEQVTGEMEKLVAAMLDKIKATKLYDDVIADYGDEKRHGIQKLISLFEQIPDSKEMTQLRKLEPAFLKLLGQKGQLRERIDKRGFEARQRHLRGE